MNAVATPKPVLSIPSEPIQLPHGKAVNVGEFTLRVTSDTCVEISCAEWGNQPKEYDIFTLNAEVMSAWIMNAKRNPVGHIDLREDGFWLRDPGDLHLSLKLFPFPKE